MWFYHSDSSDNLPPLGHIPPIPLNTYWVVTALQNLVSETAVNMPTFENPIPLSRESGLSLFDQGRGA